MSLQSRVADAVLAILSHCLFALMWVGLYAYGLAQSRTESDYREAYRPQWHFSPPKAWMNDPNGLVYHEGEYHLFYQFHPDSTIWGPMHWGHAVSRDLRTWEHLPIALYPDSLGYIFSGSVVIDNDNATGFAPAGSGIKPMVAIFTYHNMELDQQGRIDRESQGIAYSLDKGRTWTKYAQNPVLKNKGDLNFRDPKVFWYALERYWVMLLAVGDHIEFFRSTDLKSWTQTGEFGRGQGAHGGTWECPDLMPMGSDEAGNTLWILIQNIDRGAANGGSGTQYFVGYFDGKAFRNAYPRDTVLWLDYGADCYAGITWANAPNDRRILLAWMSNWDDYATKVPTHPWRSAMTMPRELTLKPTAEGWRLFQTPIAELDALLQQPTTLRISEGEATWESKKFGNPCQKIDLHITLTKQSAQYFGLVLYNDVQEKITLGYDRLFQTMYIDRSQSGKKDFSKKFATKHTAPLSTKDELHLEIWLDRASMEVFVNGGQLAMTEIFFPTQAYNRLKLFVDKGTLPIIKGTMTPIRGIWSK